MKRRFFTFFAIVFCSLNIHALGTWTQETDFVTSLNAPFSPAVMLTIGAKAYLFTGDSLNNFYQFDPIANTWSAKADFPGRPRKGAMGFATGGYGYVGGGATDYQHAAFHDFYKYDTLSDTWTAKANYPDSVMGGLSFSLNGYGYFGGGFNTTSSHFYTTFNYSNKLYQYDPAANQWHPKAAVPSQGRLGYFSASLGTKGYFTSGYLVFPSGGFNDFWEYDMQSDSWTPGPAYPGATSGFNGGNGVFAGFANASRIYVDDYTTDSLWIYDSLSSSWTSDALYPSNTFCQAHGVAGCCIGGNGFIVSTGSCSISNTWEYNPSLHFTITGYQPNTSVCEGALITVTFTSNAVFDSTNYFQLYFPSPGAYLASLYSDYIMANQNGTYTFHVPTGLFQYVSTTGPTAQYSFYVTSSSPALLSSNQGSVLVENGPKLPNFYYSYSSYDICNGNMVSLDPGNGYTGQTYAWKAEPQDSLIATSAILSYGPPQPGNYLLSFISSIPQTGCTTTDTFAVTEFALPNPNISASSYAICPGDSVVIGGVPDSTYFYQWSDHNGFNSYAYQPKVSPHYSDTYTLTVTDYNTAACTASQSVSVNVKQPPSQALCMVTVDSGSSYNVLVWEKLDKQATDSFYIYREITTNNFVRIASIFRDSLSQYNDYAANPNVTGYRYKITALDTCGNESYQSDYHNTIHLQYLGGGNLQWNQYEIENQFTPVSSYDVYRDSLNTGDWQLFISIPGSQTTATDPNFAANPNAKYRVQANWSYTCTSSRSTFGAVISNSIKKQVVTGTLKSTETISVSVMPNPSTGIFTVNFEVTNPSDIQIQVIDLLGRTVYMEKPFSTNRNVSKVIQLKDVSQGVYIVQLKVNAVVINKKISIE